MLQATREEVESFRSQFAEIEKRGEDWLTPIRRAALERFGELGFPTTREEEWRFTHLGPLVSTRFRLAEPESALQAEPADVAPFRVLAEASIELVFVNGFYARHLSSVGSLPRGAVVGSLREALVSHRDLVEPHLTRHAGWERSPFSALNAAFLSDGAFVYLPDRSVLEEPVHLLFFSTAPGAPTVSHPRNLVVCGANSQARIVESYGGRGGDVYFTNAVTEIAAGENAAVDHYKLQRESLRAFQVATIQFHQERSSVASNHSISLGGRLVRNDINTRFGGPGGECALNGLYMVGGEQHVDHHTIIDHAEPHCTSRELYKGILDDRATAVFNGRVIVRPGALKTDADQHNKNLLLSKEALVNTNPQLEIHADDVKCSHGATIGQLDADALFYLRTRGIDRETARSLLTYGFMSEISGRIRVPAIRSELEREMFRRLSPSGS